MGSPAPRFRNNPEATKKMLVVVDTLAKDEEFTLPRLGLRRNAIMQIIRKHMDERRRKESEQLEVTGKLSTVSGRESDTSSNVSGSSPESDEAKSNKLEDYYNTGEPYYRYLSGIFCVVIIYHSNKCPIPKEHLLLCFHLIHCKCPVFSKRPCP